jgi:hypothetical protein
MKPSLAVPLHRVAQNENPHGEQQKLQHLARRYVVAQLGYHRQRGNCQADKLQESCQGFHECEATGPTEIWQGGSPDSGTIVRASLGFLSSWETCRTTRRDRLTAHSSAEPSGCDAPPVEKESFFAMRLP